MDFLSREFASEGLRLSEVDGRASAGASGLRSSWRLGTVAAVGVTTLDVLLDGDSEATTVGMTTSCADAIVGCRCLVLVLGHLATAVEVLAWNGYEPGTGGGARYEVGDYWITESSDTPADRGYPGTWVKVEGVFLLGSSSGRAAGTTGGEESHALTASEMPAHAHTASTGSAGAHSHTASTASAGSHKHTMNSVGITNGYQNSNSAAWECARDVNKSNYMGGTPATTSNGAHTHTVSVASGGAHTHTVSVGSAGGGAAHNNMPPYRAVNIWRRIA